MSEPATHLGDAIQDLLDGRLDPAREAVVRSHLAECDVCRQEWQRLEWLKKRLHALSDPAAVAADLEPAIRAALDRERTGRPSAITSVDASSASAPPPRRVWRVPSALAAGIAALLVVAIGTSVWWFRPPSPAEIASDYVSLAAGARRLDTVTSDPGELERSFLAHGDVPARVYDLAMMQYTLVGGRVQAHRGRAPARLPSIKAARRPCDLRNVLRASAVARAPRSPHAQGHRFHGAPARRCHHGVLGRRPGDLCARGNHGSRSTDPARVREGAAPSLID